MIVDESFLPPLAVQFGLLCMVAQLVLTVLFAFVLPPGPWTALPGLTAHQAVCFPLMLYLTYQGFTIWHTELDELNSRGTEGRIFGVSPSGADLGAVVWGMMLLWDIPVSFMVPTLQDPLMLAHHIGMMFVSGVCMGVFSKDGHPIGSYYASFFFGIIELSSLFLTIVDTFHPKNKAWYEWIEHGATSGARVARTVNEICRPLFALSYLGIRCGFFPYVMFSTCLADFWKAAMLKTEAERHGISQMILLMVCALCVGFTYLQFSWGILVARQVVKALGLMPSSSSKVSSNLRSKED